MNGYRSMAVRQVDKLYERDAHHWIANLADELAQQLKTDLLKQGAHESDIKFGVMLQMRLVSGGPLVEIPAIYFDPNYDWDADYKKAMALSGVARHTESPGDIAFRIGGKSAGYFLGLQPRFRFCRAYEKQGYSVSLLHSPILIEAVKVEAWTDHA